MFSIKKCQLFEAATRVLAFELKISRAPKMLTERTKPTFYETINL